MKNFFPNLNYFCINGLINNLMLNSTNWPAIKLVNLIIWCGVSTERCWKWITSDLFVVNKQYVRKNIKFNFKKITAKNHSQIYTDCQLWVQTLSHEDSSKVKNKIPHIFLTMIFDQENTQYTVIAVKKCKNYKQSFGFLLVNYWAADPRRGQTSEIPFFAPPFFALYTQICFCTVLAPQKF